jgi:hypothetical protein
LFGAVEGEIEAGVVEGLQEIVQGSGFKGSQGVLVVGGYEDYGWRDVVAQKLQDVESVALWHLDVEEDEVGLCASDECRGVRAGAAFADDFNAGVEAKEYG